jgi:hypothetical protein
LAPRPRCGGSGEREGAAASRHGAAMRDGPPGWLDGP